jgi:sensor histidine kinase YesM
LGDRLKVEWDIDPNTLSLKVPSLVLQPLVENAIQHGIASSNQTGKLSIRVQHENGFLHLQVRDTGPGMRSDREPANAGIGLSNTDARLRTLYGDRYRFEWINDHGLSVHMHLPLPCPT